MKFQGNSISQTPVQPYVSDSSLDTLYLDCSKLPLDRFIDCLIDNDLSQLIITGRATEKQLAEAWDKIYVQYCQLSQDGTYNEVFAIMKDINDLRAKITIVNNIVQYLQLSYDSELVNVLNVFALRCDIVETDKDIILIKKLNSVIGRIKKWFPQLRQREKELEKLRFEKADNIGREYFDDVLEVMSDVKGYQVEAAKITVSRFCRSLVKMNNEAQKKLLKNKKQNYGS